MAVADAEVGLLHRISNIVSSELSVDEILGGVLGLATQATACDACLVYLFDRQSNEIVLQASLVPHAADLGKLRIKVGEGVTGWVAEHMSAVALAEDAFADPRFKHFQTLIEDTYEAFLSVPLVSAGDLRELETRKIVERAKGILQQKYGMSEEDAYFRLRNQSRRLRRPMRALAEAIILSEDLDREPSAAARDERVA